MCTKQRFCSAAQAKRNRRRNRGKLSESVNVYRCHQVECRGAWHIGHTTKAC